MESSPSSLLSRIPDYWLGVITSLIVFAFLWLAFRSPEAVSNTVAETTETAPITSASANTPASATSANALRERVLPAQGVVLPIIWGDLGARMIETGVIDKEKFIALYTRRGGLTPPMQALLSDAQNGAITMTAENAPFLLNLFWALGLGNRNTILSEGPMTSPAYGGDPGGFASTGGWSLAIGNPMDHYGAHALVTLTTEQQALVERVSKGIYRPCCGNSTYFPDCNHGMAMLGLLELMASQGVNEGEMYRAALAVNAFWFPETYLTIASYFDEQGLAWESVDPRVALGAEYSSGAGYQQLKQRVAPVTPPSGGGGCGV